MTTFSWGIYPYHEYMSISRTEVVPVGYEAVDWRRAECAGKAIDADGHDVFYKEDREQSKHYAEREQRAKDLCRQCQILYDCKEYALTSEIYGVWGGMSEQDRQTWRRAAGYRGPKL